MKNFKDTFYCQIILLLSECCFIFVAAGCISFILEDFGKLNSDPTTIGFVAAIFYFVMRVIASLRIKK